MHGSDGRHTVQGLFWIPRLISRAGADCETHGNLSPDQGVDEAVGKIRVLVVGMPTILNAIVRDAITGEGDMTVVEQSDTRDDLGMLTRRRKIDVVLFSLSTRAPALADIERLLHGNPRLGVLMLDGSHDSGAVHRLVRACNEFAPLARSTLTAAIRTGAALRRS
jgi:DNA-binding NarL/FixJ family response regulator